MLLSKQSLFTIIQAAEILGVSPKTIRRLKSKGVINPQTGSNRQILISVNDLDILRNILNKPLVNKTYPVADTAKMLSVSSDTIRRWEKEGKIKSIRTVGGHRRFSTEAIQQVKNKKYQPVRTEKQIPIPPREIVKIIDQSQFFVPHEILNPNPLPLFNLKLISFVAVSSLLIFIATSPLKVGRVVNKLTGISVPGIPEEELITKSEGDWLSVLSAQGGIYEGDVGITGGVGISGSLDVSSSTTTEDLVVSNSASMYSLSVTSGLVVGDNEIINSSGKIPALNGSYFENLSGENITNVDAHHLGGVAASSFLRSNEVDTAEAVINFTATPGSTDVNGGPVYINPAASTSNYTLFGIALNGSQRFKIDAEGDVSIAGNTNIDGTIYGDGSGITNVTASSVTFANITAGTNTAAAMVVGNGASLTYSGTGTITASDLTCTDCLDFTEFADNLTLDSATDIALGALTLSTSGTGALDYNSTGQVSFAGNVNAENGLDVTTADLTVGGANFSVAQATGNITTAGDLAVNGGDITSTGALTITPQASNNLNIALSTTGDFVVNTDDLVVDTSEGRVGIGTAGPGYKLDVNGFTRLSTGVKIGSTNSGGWLYYPNVASYKGDGTVAGAIIVHTNIGRASAEMFKIRVTGYGYQQTSNIDFTLVGYLYDGTAGNVDGVNGAVVNYSINDNGNDGLTKRVGIDTNGKLAVSIGDYDSSFYFYRVSADYWSTRNIVDASTGWSVNANTTSGFGWLDIHQLSPAVTQLTSGYVGIGTTDPGSKLDVSGGDIALQGSYWLTWANSSSAASDVGLNFGFGTEIIRVASDGHLKLSSQNSKIELDGSVGIGISPTYKLDVDGVIRGQATVASGDVLLVGNDAKIVDIDASHTLGVYSQSTPTQGGLKLGSGGGEIFGSSSNIGINRYSATNDLEVEGTASKTAAGDWLANSDIRIKRDVLGLDNALDIIDLLRPVKFKYTDEYMEAHPSLEDRYYYNFIAQEFQEVFPDAVQDSGENGILQMDSYNVRPYLVAAMQELNTKVSALELESETGLVLGLDSENLEDGAGNIETEEEAEPGEPEDTQEEKVESMLVRIDSLETEMLLLQSSFDLTSPTNATDSSFLTSLNVLGDSVLGDTVVNGRLDVGILSFDNLTGSIDAIGVLKIQPLALGNIEFMGGLVTIDPSGNMIVNEITAKKYKVSGNSAGSSYINSGETSTWVETDTVRSSSLVFITPTTITNFPLSVTEKSSSSGFRVEIEKSLDKDIYFDWWIIESE